MKHQRRKKNQRGSASIEAITILVVFLVLMSYGLGFFGVIHTAILHSIGARSYAFETFRNRTNIKYHRDTTRADILLHSEIEIRYHGIQAASSNGSTFQATERDIAVTDIGRDPNAKAGQTTDHTQRIYEIDGRNREGGVEISPSWVMVGYGMCINANCGD